MMKIQNRRSFLRATTIGGAAAITGTRSDATGKYTDNPLDSQTAPISRGYPVLPIVKATELNAAAATSFHYPDKGSPCLLIKTGSAVPGGVGPQRDIVAYSAMCTHMGCLVAYDADTQTLKCPCHFSVFDPENCGQMVCGQATEDLPQIELSFDKASGRISAVGVRGSLYGRISNVL